MSAPARHSVLTAPDCEHFLEHGFVVVRRAVPETVVAATVAALDEREDGAPENETGKGPGAEAEPTMAACITDRVRGALGALFGPGCPFECVRGGIRAMPRPHQPGAVWLPWELHVDSDYPTPLPNGWALGALIFLTPVRPRGGSFVFCPGSYRRYRALLSEAPGALKACAPFPEYAGPYQEYLAEPGDLLLYHHLMAHCGSVNVSDPTTRHALLSWWHAADRLVPGSTPFARMSPLERANSARYLRHRFGIELPLPEYAGNARMTAVLRSGHPPLRGYPASGGIAAHALLHWGGKANRVFVEEVAPSVIRRQSTRNLLDWHEEPPLRLDAGPVRFLSLFQWGREIVLVAGGTEGARLLSSSDLRVWTQLAQFPDWTCAAPHFHSVNASPATQGKVLFFVPCSDAAAVRCRWGTAWHALSACAASAAAPAGSVILDLQIQPVYAESLFALVADLEAPGGSRPMYSLSRDSARYASPLLPLTFASAAPPRRIRVYARGEGYWLVSYIRRHHGQDRFFWGALDWSEQPVTLRELGSTTSLEEAFYLTGIR